MNPAKLRSVLKSLSADEVVDWEAAESAADQTARGLLRELQVIAKISAAHQGAAADVTASRVLRFGRSEETVDKRVSEWGRLVLRERLAHGADGEVHRAFDNRLQREVALKLVRSGHAEAQVARFLNEARLLARVRHGNVVTVYGADVIDGTPGIWMELIVGSTLQQLVSRQGPFGAQEAAVIGAELCRALAAIHQAGILHRDIKAQNVMREAGGRIVLMDFSVSAADSKRSGVAGTPAYLAPELLTGQPASRQSDLYSIGVLLFYLATGTYPIAGSSVAQIALAHEQGLRKRLRDARADLPTAFVAAVERAVSSDPAMRPGSAGELEDLLMHSLPGHASSVGPAPVVSPRRRRSWLVAGAIAAAVAIGGISIARWPLLNERVSTPLALEARPWILVSSFDNRTGNHDLDGVLESALERELIASAQFRVASRPRIDDVLRLMRRPVETPLDAGVAREVALRDGGISTLVSGRIEQVGSTTILSASIVAVQTGDVIGSVSEEAVDATAVPPAIRRLANRLRLALGETATSIQISADALERVTTPSLKALRSYTAAIAAADRNQWPAALTLAQEAVREDRNFAAAHAWLAWAMMRNRYTREQYLDSASTAMKLSGTTSDWERLWIDATHAGLSDEVDREFASLDALLRIYPDHWWAANNLVGLHSRAGRDAEAVRPALRLIELRPHDYNALYVVFDLHIRLGRLDEAAQYATRIKSSEGFNRRPSGDAWVFDAFRQWHNGNASAAVQALQRVVGEAQGLNPELRDAVLTRSAAMWLALGRPTDARSALAKVTQSGQRHLAEATVAHAVGDSVVARREVIAARLASLPAEESDAVQFTQWSFGMSILSRSDARDARALFEVLGPIALKRRAPLGTAIASVMAGHVALAEGNIDDGIQRLAAVNLNAITPQVNFRRVEALAEAYAKRGELASAARTLESVTVKKHLALTAPYWWMRCELQLAEVYERMGRHSEASQIAAGLQRSLTEAEAGFQLAQKSDALLFAR